MPDSQSDYPVKRPWTSLVTTLVVQSQNAFNDNFLKTLLITLAAVVAAGTVMGDEAKRIFSAFIPALFLMFSPLAGWMSDKYSKRSVMFWSIVAQIILLGITILSLFLQNLYLAMGCLVLLSAQSTIFSPAKQGILKELVGSKKLTIANAMLQMFTMVAIIAGIALAAMSFGQLQGNAVEGWLVENPEHVSSLEIPAGLSGADIQKFKIESIPAQVKKGFGWSSAFVPVLVVSLAALFPLLMNFFIDKTPAQSPDAKFEWSILFKHFGYLAEVFQTKEMTKTALGITFYWLLAGYLGVAIFDIAEKLHPDVGSGAAATETFIIYGIMGGGLVLGSLLVAVLCAKGNRLKLIPIGGMGMFIALVVSSFLSVKQLGGVLPETALPANLINLPLYLSMGGIGFFGAFFLVPLSTNLQDKAPNDKRGRVIGAVGVLTSFAGLVAIAISYLFNKFNLPPSVQLMCFVIPTLLITLYVSTLIKSQRTDSST